VDNFSCCTDSCIVSLCQYVLNGSYRQVAADYIGRTVWQLCKAEQHDNYARQTLCYS